MEALRVFPAWIILLWPLIILFAIWDVVWKGIALWRAARNGNVIWFIFILIVNSLGILPIIYILAFSKRPQAPQPPQAPQAPPPPQP